MLLFFSGAKTLTEPIKQTRKEVQYLVSNNYPPKNHTIQLRQGCHRMNQKQQHTTKTTKVCIKHHQMSYHLGFIIQTYS